MLKKLISKIRLKELLDRVCKKPELFFLMLAGTTGFIMVFVLPPFQAPDEHTHFYKAVQLSYGQISAEKKSSTEVGSYLPSKYSQTVDKFSYLWTEPIAADRISSNYLKEQIFDGPTGNDTIFTKYENTAVYPPIAYLPQSVAVFVTRSLDFPVIVQLYAARIAVLMVWLTLFYLTIRIIPVGKWGMTALAFTPQVFMLSASSSNDVIAFGTCAVFIAYVVRLRIRTTALTSRDYVFLTLLTVAIGLLKPPYFLILAVIFLIPSGLFKSTIRSYLIKVSAIGASVITAILWALTTRDLYIPTNLEADTAAQVSYILQNPLAFAKAMLYTFFLSNSADALIAQNFNLQSWLAVRIPFIFTIVGYVAMIVAIVVRNPREPRLSFGVFPRLLTTTLFLIGGFTVMGLIYLSFNPPGNSVVIGMNIRYLIPFMFLATIIAGSLLSLKSVRDYDRAIVFTQLSFVSIAVATVLFTLLRYYGSHS